MHILYSFFCNLLYLRNRYSNFKAQYLEVFILHFFIKPLAKFVFEFHSFVFTFLTNIPRNKKL